VVIISIEQTEPYLRARLRLAPVPEERSTEIEALQRAIVELAGRAIQLAQPNAAAEFAQMLATNDDPRTVMSRFTLVRLHKEQRRKRQRDWDAAVACAPDARMQA
jgi:hypothetical protein